MTTKRTHGPCHCVECENQDPEYAAFKHNGRAYTTRGGLLEVAEDPCSCRGDGPCASCTARKLTGRNITSAQALELIMGRIGATPSEEP